MSYSTNNLYAVWNIYNLIINDDVIETFPSNIWT